MTMSALLTRLVDAALASPSVHNVQPARWRIDGDALVLLEDTARRLAVGDPRGHDAAISLGAATEGLAIAASGEGLATQVERLDGEDGRLATGSPASPSPPARRPIRCCRCWKRGYRGAGDLSCRHRRRIAPLQQHWRRRIAPS